MLKLPDFLNSVGLIFICILSLHLHIYTLMIIFYLFQDAVTVVTVMA